MGTTLFSSSSLRFSLFGLVSLLGCGGRASAEGQTLPTGSAGSAGANQTRAGAKVSGGAATAGNTGTAGPSTTICPVESPVAAPTVSTDCNIALRLVDPTPTCRQADCAIAKALDLTCASYPYAPWISATTDGTVVMARAWNSDLGTDLARLMTVEATDSQVQDVPVLAAPSGSYADTSIMNSALAINSNGEKWLFAGHAPFITALRDTGVGWTSATVVPSPDPNAWATLTGARMVDDSLGYLTYSRYHGFPWSDISSPASFGALPSTLMRLEHWFLPATSTSSLHTAVTKKCSCTRMRRLYKPRTESMAIRVTAASSLPS